jgi:hypothetical protein
VPDDFGRATAAPGSLRINGREYLVSRFTPRDIGDLQQFMKEILPDPRSRVRELIRDLPESVALQVWKDMNAEARDWPPSFGSEQSTSILTTTFEGNARLLWVTLRKHNPGFDLNAARELAGVVEFEDINRIIALASPESAGDPKAGKTDPTTATAT